MSTFVWCRTCGEKINNLNAKNLFEHENNNLLDKIETLTGIWLDDVENMPKHICSCCYLDLNNSIAFRERCIIEQQLLRSKGWMQKDTAALDPLNTPTNVRATTSQICIRKQTQHTIVRAHTEPYYVSPHSHIVRARLPKQPLYINNEITDALVSGQHTKSGVKHVMITRSREQQPVAGRDKRVIKTTSNAASTSTEDCDGHTTNKPNVRRHTVSKTYVCDQCGKCFTDASNLKVHILRHTGVKNFECTECGSKYFTRHLLNLHTRVRHQGEMPYACKYCDQRFYTSTARCRHERVKHTRKSSYVCRLCGKTYLTKSCLNKHEFLHTGERPYRCDICNVGFPRNTNLRIHYRSKQHQKRASEALDKQFDVIDALSNGETEIDSIIEEFDV